jgi:hypothetical protein
MTIDEATRRKLSNRLREVLGKSQADALMTLLPNQPLPELATREDVAAMTTTLRAEFRAEMEQRFAAVDRQFGELKGELGELKGELGELKGELKAEFARQTVTLALTLGSLIIAVLGTILTLGFTGAFA